jgi:hypothetical protein
MSSKTRYSATFMLPSGSEFVLTRGSRQDYGYTGAWIVLNAHGAVIGKGFSRERERAEYEAGRYVQADPTRTAMVAPVTKEGAS